MRDHLQKHPLKGNNELTDYDESKTIFILACSQEENKVVRGNSAPFMNEVLSEAFMYRSRFKNRYNVNANELNKSLYKKQRNFCVNLLRKEKRKYYNNLDIKISGDNRKFWHNVKPLFSNKQIVLQKNIIIVEKGIITFEKLSNFFIEDLALTTKFTQGIYTKL